MPVLLRLGGLGISLGGPPVAAQITDLSSCGCSRSLCASEVSKTPGGFGWSTRRRVQQLGTGNSPWTRSVSALETAEGLDLPWAKWWRSGTSSRWAKGDVLVVGARIVPLVWAVNVNTVVEVTRRRRRVSISWATTSRHVLRGTETVSVERKYSSAKKGDQVFFHIENASRPDHVVAWTLYPLVALLQAKFTVDVCKRFHHIAQRD